MTSANYADFLKVDGLSMNPLAVGAFIQRGEGEEWVLVFDKNCRQEQLRPSDLLQKRATIVPWKMDFMRTCGEVAVLVKSQQADDEDALNEGLDRPGDPESGSVPRIVWNPCTDCGSRDVRKVKSARLWPLNQRLALLGIASICPRCGGTGRGGSLLLDGQFLE